MGAEPERNSKTSVPVSGKSPGLAADPVQGCGASCGP